MINIRLATQDDVKAIVRHGRAFWSAIPYCDVPYCPDSVALTCGHMIAQGLLVYAEVDGECAGFIGALRSPLFLNREYHVAAELWFWVEPQHRKTGIGRMMLNQMESAAKTAGIYRLSMMAIEGMQLDRVAAMYEADGYEPAERTWSKRLWP